MLNYNTYYGNRRYNDNPNPNYYVLSAYQPVPVYRPEPMIKQHAMNIKQAFIAFWKNYGNFIGTAPRSEYWWNELIEILISIGLMAFGILVGNMIIGVLLMILYWLIAAVPNWSLNARRLHDIGLSGWWQLPLSAIDFGMLVVGVIKSKPYSKYRISPTAFGPNQQPQVTAPQTPYYMNPNPNQYYSKHPNIY